MTTKHIFSLDEIVVDSTIVIPFCDDTNFKSLLNDASYTAPGLEPMLACARDKKGSSFSLFITSNAGKQFILILWNIESSHPADINKKALAFGKRNQQILEGHIVLDLRWISSQREKELIVNHVIRGIDLSNYETGKLKSESPTNKSQIHSISILSIDDSLFDRQIHRAFHESATTKSIMDLVNAPANHKSPKVMSTWMKKAELHKGLKVSILELDQIKQLGLHALVAVNRGSEFPACCLVMEYSGPRCHEDSPVIALVGKGVTFDSGGLSIKPANNMHYMKSDMGGAAAVMGAFELIAKLQLNVRVVGVVPCTDNSVDKLAVKPGDVINSYSGSTIEVIDTDAEGRLILADGLHYAIKNFKPTYVVNLATLTGSIVRTLGAHAAGLMTKSDLMRNSLIKAGDEIGERLWPLPLWDDYDSYLHSDIADIRNLSTKPVAGAITAGKFLEHFTDDHPHWAHIDMAGTAFGTTVFSKGYSATGYGIRLLTYWVELITKQHLT